jgi:hypothetical protein
MASDLVAAVHALRPNATWSVGDRNDYSTLVWKDVIQTKPTQAEVTSMIATLQATDAAEQQRKSGISGDAQVAAMVSRLQTATSTQIDDYLTANVTTLAQARAVLGAVIKVMALFVQTK